MSCTTLMLQLHCSTVYARLPRHGCKSVLPCSYRTSAIGGPPYMVPYTKHPSISSRSYQMSAVGGLALTAYVTPQWVPLLSILPNTSPGHSWATFQSPETSTTSSLWRPLSWSLVDSVLYNHKATPYLRASYALLHPRLEAFAQWPNTT